MIDWTGTVVRGIVVGVIALAGFALLWAARRSGKVEQELKDQLAGEKTKAEIVEKSDASAEAADTRRAPDSLHVAPDVVRGDTIPEWAKR